MIKEKIKTKKRTLSVALLLIIIVLAVSSNISIIQAHAYTNESTDYETQYRLIILSCFYRLTTK